jgi:hypothetical protein
VVRPSKLPFDYLAEVLPSQLTPELSLEEQAKFITYCRSKLPLGGEGLRDIISTMVNAAHGPGQARILLVVDQFEELFLHTFDHKIREKYIDVLLSSGCWGASVPVHLLLVLRTEFYSNFLQHPALRRAWEKNCYHVPAMSREQLRESIEKRLILGNAHAESGLIDSVLNDFDSEPRCVALLESVLEQLWIKCGGFGCTLTYSAYSQTGGWRCATSTNGMRDCRQGHARSMESRSRPTTAGRRTDLA